MADAIAQSARKPLLSPGWPVPLVFVLYPIWWLLGLTGVVWLLAAVAMLIWLMRQPRIRVPRGFGIWLLFLAWVFASLLMIDDAGRFQVALHRASLYISAAIFLVYVYNLPSRLLPRVVGALAVFWAAVVWIGLGAVIWSSLELPSLAAKLLPRALLSSGYVVELTTVRLAQVHDFLGFPIGRPTGPFVYTNQWGSAIALLTPFAVLAMSVRPQPWRRLVPVFALVGLIPLVVSLDRGAWLSLCVAALYALFRMTLRFQLGTVAKVLLTIGMLSAVVWATPLGGLLTERIETPHSNQTRFEIYKQVIQEVEDQPLFGYGGPRDAAGPYLPPLGTHGGFWLVLYSQGVPGALMFVGFFLAMWWRTRRARSTGFWPHVVILVGLVQLAYYDLLPVGLHLLMIAAALALRDEAGRLGGESTAVEGPHAYATP